MIEIEMQVGSRVFTRIEEGYTAMGDSISKAVDGAARPITDVMRRALQLVAKEMKAQHASGWNGQVVNQSADLQRRSGDSLNAMAKSISVKGSGNLANLQGQISTGFWAIHETGGTIRARSQYLTIPLPAAMDSRGVPLRKRARDWDNTFVKMSKRGNLLIFRSEGRGRIIPLYLLKNSVTIRPRLGMERAILDTALPYFEQKSLDAFERSLTRSLS